MRSCGPPSCLSIGSVRRDRWGSSSLEMASPESVHAPVRHGWIALARSLSLRFLLSLALPGSWPIGMPTLCVPSILLLEHRRIRILCFLTFQRALDSLKTVVIHAIDGRALESIDESIDESKDWNTEVLDTSAFQFHPLNLFLNPLPTPGRNTASPVGRTDGASRWIVKLHFRT
jgi:hypothetical protein